MASARPEPFSFGLHLDWAVIVGHHFREQMRARNVSEEMVRETLRSCDACYPSKTDKRTNIVKRFGEDKVRIVAKEDSRARMLFLVTVIVHGQGGSPS